jgi:hypothetical protein
MFDSFGVVQRQNAEDVTRFEADAELLDQLNDTVLGCNQRHVHFHDLSSVEP